ncbi:hypothetical protein L1049_001602 [Liquidambar formosana]|uniref:Uncharacterized protein n=1 Tax=Liquidambar formosana TaxID=63359 RepID=A0AAP0N6W1_LIQFO
MQSFKVNPEDLHEHNILISDGNMEDLKGRKKYFPLLLHLHHWKHAPVGEVDKLIGVF